MFLLGGCSSCQGQKSEGDKDVITTRINDTLSMFEDFFSNGQKKTEGYTNSDGKLTGKYSLWYDNGVKQSEFNYNSGLRTGEQRSWYKSGILATTDNYYNDTLNGTSTFYIETGEFGSEDKYVMGKKISHQECIGYYKPDKQMLKTYTDLGLDSLTAVKILRENLSGMVVKTDSGIIFKEDTNVRNTINSVLHQADSVQTLKQKKPIPVKKNSD